jgi:sugar lactone lactonase YvrE
VDEKTLWVQILLLLLIYHAGFRSYFTDSLVNLIYMYDYDVEDGTLSNRRTAIDAKQLGYTGFCDGLCIDTEGAIWSAR